MERFILHQIYGMSAEDLKRFDRGRDDDGSLLEDTVTGETYLDGWEPEDATFLRDLGWVPTLLNALAAETEEVRQERDEARAALRRADEQGAEAIERISAAIVADKWNSTAELQDEVRRLTALVEVQRRPVGLVLAEVARERERQRAKGYNDAHDDQHRTYELSTVAAAVALGAADHLSGDVPEWAEHIIEKWDVRRRLVIAAALMVAEIERLDRAAQVSPC